MPLDTKSDYWPFVNIPKVVNLYWGRNKPLSVMRYLSIKSLSDLNPGWKINLHIPSISNFTTYWKTKENKHKLDQKDRLWNTSTMSNVDIVVCKMDELGIPEGVPEVHKSDILRWRVMRDFGGVWSDTDILFLKPLACLSTIDFESNIALCQYRNEKHKLVMPIGFFMGGGDYCKKFFGKVFQLAMDMLVTDYSLGYQIFGRFLLEKVFNEEVVENISLISRRIVYPYVNPLNYYNGSKVVLGPETIGIHWYAGHDSSGRCESATKSLSDVNKTDCYLFREMRKFI